MKAKNNAQDDLKFVIFLSKEGWEGNGDESA
jgi:hypothetical protein